MLDRISMLEDTVRRWQDRELDNPNHINGFRGEFSFSDHSVVPETVRNLVMHVTPYERFRSVPLEEITRIARETHGGKPGFIVRATERIIQAVRERHARQSDEPVTKTAHVYENELTIDDWNGDQNDRKTELDT